MKKKKLCCGIDVSQETLDISFQTITGGFCHERVGNNQIGFEKILQLTGKTYHFVMEATGSYYIRLAFFLKKNGCKISVVNALSIKRYIQMQLERNKSDKKDAGWICRYAIDQKPRYWEAPDRAYFQARQLYQTIKTFSEQSTRLDNQLHNLQLLPLPSKDALRSLLRIKQKLQQEVHFLEARLEKLLNKWKPEQLKNVRTVKGIGKKASAILIIFTQGFKHTINYRQLVSFAGLNPTEYSSGTSIQGRSRIGKRGGKVLRNVLYMCSMNAIRTNDACKNLYTRLRLKGKNGKQALIAVCQKLLKQVFAVVKNNTCYQPNYCSVKPGLI